MNNAQASAGAATYDERIRLIFCLFTACIMAAVLAAFARPSCRIPTVGGR